MTQSDTQEGYRADIGRNFKKRILTKTTLASPIHYLRPTLPYVIPLRNNPSIDYLMVIPFGCLSPSQLSNCCWTTMWQLIKPNLSNLQIIVSQSMYLSIFKVKGLQLLPQRVLSQTGASQRSRQRRQLPRAPSWKGPWQGLTVVHISMTRWLNCKVLSGLEPPWCAELPQITDTMWLGVFESRNRPE